MKKIFFLCLLLFLGESFGVINPDNITPSLIELENVLSSQGINFEKVINLEQPKKHLNEVLNDHLSRVDDRFKIEPYFKKRTMFWFSIYTQYSFHEVLIHDKENLELVYSVINLESIHQTSLNPYVKSYLQNKYTQNHVQKIKNQLNSIYKKNLRLLTTEEKSILLSLKKANIKIPKKKKEREVFFRKLALNLRTQTGQKDKIHKGVMRAVPYFPFLEKKIKELSLPKEILAVAFLESGFNFNAVSKVDAVGAWQFMSYTANLTMPKINEFVDYRKSPIISSLAAIQLLKENKLILKRWDLAITAYNSGTKNLVNARKKFKATKSLSYILKNYKNKYLGFASKNFYAEFLALVHALAYKDLIYPLPNSKKTIKTEDANKKIDIYLTKCPLTPRYFFKELEKKSARIKELNGHILKPHRKYKKGLILVSEKDLSPRKYLKLTKNQINSGFPKSFLKYLKNKKCNKL